MELLTKNRDQTISLIRSLIFSFVFLFLTGCVTTTDSSLTRKADPEEAVEKYVQLGLEYIKRNDYTRARKHLNRALEIDESNSAANSALGLIYHQEDEVALAEKSLQLALSSDPDYTRGRTYYGAFLFSEGRYEEALAQFNKASEDTEYERREQVFTNIALCHINLNQNVDALAAYEKALRLDRFNGRALAGATELLIEQGNYDRAQFLYNRLVRMISQEGLKHSAQSLWMGIRISRHFGRHEQENSLGELLKELYPNSQQFHAYAKLLQGQ